MMFNRSRAVARSLFAVSALGAGAAANAAVDIAPITAALGDVGTVGAAVFALFVGMKIFRWIRGIL